MNTKSALELGFKVVTVFGIATLLYFQMRTKEDTPYVDAPNSTHFA